MTTTEHRATAEPVMRVYTADGVTEQAIPGWAADVYPAEYANRPGVSKVEVLGTEGGVAATFTAVVPLPSVIDAELAYLADLLVCGACGCIHLPSVQCPGPCPDCRAEAGQSCEPTCPSRFENPGE